MGSPVRRQINPIMRCWDQPHYGYAGTDDGRGTDQRLDTKRLTRMSGRSCLTGRRRSGVHMIPRRLVGYRPAVGMQNYLIEGVSGTGKTSVCQELRRRGFHAINGDTDLAYQGDPETGEPTGDVPSHWHHIW